MPALIAEHSSSILNFSSIPADYKEDRINNLFSDFKPELIKSVTITEINKEFGQQGTIEFYDPAIAQ